MVPALRRGETVRGGEDGASAQLPDSGLLKNRAVAAEALRTTEFEHLTAGERIGVEDVRHGFVQTLAIRRGKPVEQGAIGRNRFQQAGRRAHLFQKREIGHQPILPGRIAIMTKE